MAKKALIILAQGFEEIEAITVIDILRRAEIDLTVAGLDNVKIRGSRGLNVIADKKLEESDSGSDACILPGGTPGAGNLARSETVKNLIQKMDQDGKLIAAICAAPAVVLAPTGILENKSATCYPGMQDKFGKSTQYKENAVVKDRHIITSQGPGTALAFSLAIVEYLVGKDIADNLKKRTLAG